MTLQAMARRFWHQRLIAKQNVPVNEVASVSLGKQKKKNAAEKTRLNSDPETNEGAYVLSRKQKKKNDVEKTRRTSNPKTNVLVNEYASDSSGKQEKKNVVEKTRSASNEATHLSSKVTIYWNFHMCVFFAWYALHSIV